MTKLDFNIIAVFRGFNGSFCTDEMLLNVMVNALGSSFRFLDSYLLGI